MATIQEQIALLQAVADGKTLEFTRKYGCSRWAKPEASWVDSLIIGTANFYFDIYNWRIKPEPKVLWVNEYSNHLSPGVHLTEASAKANASYNVVRVAVKYQEVL